MEMHSAQTKARSGVMPMRVAEADQQMAADIIGRPGAPSLQAQRN